MEVNTPVPTDAIPDATQNQQRRKFALGFWLMLWPLVLAAWWFPIKFASLRLLLVIGVLALCSGALILFWKFKPLRVALLLGFTAVTIFLILPGRDYSRATLRSQYIASLKSYTGAPYVWGGESKHGIDCSGLVRRGLMDANFQLGLTSFNPHLVRAGLGMWWHDASAKAMMEEHRDATRVLFAARSLNELNYKKLFPGDFAVTSSGVHTLAYIGNQTWIEADPGPMRVIQVKVPAKNAWFFMSIKIVRWRQLEE